ncbi:1,2-phenylacetyl-CoA epoxidase subunit PaaC [Streptomyces himalayensis]|uniref:Phenylacetate-CoA oxygenase subunit PaaC n=1 Tax=Streptomyces himalayensis subsp. himalayensis TaxID=2756131 RepID=A0A7W0DTV6_9ACTN|nr:1,2-phenylacetyl-CoA epoxidase subunit PaaC [Streptomyces himalayensis]MBA2950364.1 phenylacetate-CoA oxygenase subunit PaaC [Streptomyces himalayensis subsp. himalayensis]
MSDDHVYMTLAEGHEDDARWAYGTGFEDPLHGVDIAVPEGVDAGEVAACCLALGDDALVSAQRLAEWCTRAPELEEEVALANIGLDLLGQARLLYGRCGQVDGTGRGEDAYAYFRDPGDFRNVRLAELPGGDFAFSITRLLVLSSWRLALFEQLTASPDPVLAAIAAKGVKELAYHRQYAAEWAVRLGDGTEESHRRMRTALEQVGPYIGELFTAYDVRDEVVAVLRQVTEAAGLPMPAWKPSPSSSSRGYPMPGAGRDGDHTEHLAPLLAELQGVARAHPEATW